MGILAGMGITTEVMAIAVMVGTVETAGVMAEMGAGVIDGVERVIDFTAPADWDRSRRRSFEPQIDPARGDVGYRA